MSADYWASELKACSLNYIILIKLFNVAIYMHVYTCRYILLDIANRW